jgi:hypothetical protein
MCYNNCGTKEARWDTRRGIPNQTPGGGKNLVMLLEKNEMYFRKFKFYLSALESKCQ